MTRNFLAYAAMFSTAVTIAGCSKNEAESATPSLTPATAAASAPESPASLASANSAYPTVKVYKDPNCGCCIKWVEHMQQNGFKVETVDMPDLSMVKQKYMIGEQLTSCHTATVGDYAIEGHVPADVIKKMLDEKPAIAGLAVPGMPSGSPGMEGAIKEKYDILTFDRAGRTTVYAQR